VILTFFFDRLFRQRGRPLLPRSAREPNPIFGYWRSLKKVFVSGQAFQACRDSKQRRSGFSRCTVAQNPSGKSRLRLDFLSGTAEADAPIRIVLLKLHHYRLSSTHAVNGRSGVQSGAVFEVENDVFG